MSNQTINRGVRNRIPINIQGYCPRCGGQHYRLMAKPLDIPIPTSRGDWTHWAQCPKSDDPILIRNPQKVTKNGSGE